MGGDWGVAGVVEPGTPSSPNLIAPITIYIVHVPWSAWSYSTC